VLVLERCGQQPETAEALGCSRDHRQFVEVLKRCFVPELTCSQSQLPETRWRAVKISPDSRLRRAEPSNSMLNGQPEIMNQIHAFAAQSLNATLKTVDFQYAGTDRGPSDTRQ
jgi:hypothetical protein